MPKLVTIDARWDDEAAVWIATSSDLPGLVVEASSWREMIAETETILPDLLDVSGETSGDITLTFRAETRRDFARAS